MGWVICFSSVRWIPRTPAWDGADLSRCSRLCRYFCKLLKIYYWSEGLPERDISALGAMGWGGRGELQREESYILEC